MAGVFKDDFVARKDGQVALLSVLFYRSSTSLVRPCVLQPPMQKRTAAADTQQYSILYDRQVYCCWLYQYTTTILYSSSTGRGYRTTVVVALPVVYSSYDVPVQYCTVWYIILLLCPPGSTCAVYTSTVCTAAVGGVRRA